jgi:hypothetical protein
MQAAAAIAGFLPRHFLQALLGTRIYGYTRSLDAPVAGGPLTRCVCLERDGVQEEANGQQASKG